MSHVSVKSELLDPRFTPRVGSRVMPTPAQALTRLASFLLGVILGSALGFPSNGYAVIGVCFAGAALVIAAVVRGPYRQRLDRGHAEQRRDDRSADELIRLIRSDDDPDHGPLRCYERTCADFGDPDFGEGTCPSWHAEPDPADREPYRFPRTVASDGALNWGATDVELGAALGHALADLAADAILADATARRALEFAERHARRAR